MIYFSELKNRSVLSSENGTLGVLADLIFRAFDVPVITKLVVTRDGQSSIIPVSFVKSLSPKIVVNDGQTDTALTENEIYVTKNILDQQIIDIKGNKIVRVNDVVIQDKPQFMIAGVDIGLLGVLRWFHLENPISSFLRLFGINVVSQFLSWGDIQPLELNRGKVVMRQEDKKLRRLMPEDLADHLEKMSIKNISKVIDLMDDRLAAEVVEDLNLTYQQSLFQTMPIERTVKLIERVDPDEAVDILLSLPQRKKQILSRLGPDKRKEIENLLKHSGTPIGGLMTSEFLTCYPEDSVSKVRGMVKKTQEFSFLKYIYVINHDDHLTGVVNLHELLLANWDAPIYKIMVPQVVVVHLSTPIEIAIKRLLKYKLEALPVIDDKRKILGLVTFDDIAQPLMDRLIL